MFHPRRLSLNLLLPLVCVSAACADEPLRVTPQNTCCSTPRAAAGAMLQYQLIRSSPRRHCATLRAGAKIDRAAAPGFPVILDKAGDHPQGLELIALGAGRYLQPEERAELEQNPGAILLRRRGNVLMVAGQPYNGQGGAATAAAEFLDRAMGIRFYAPPALWHSRPARGAVEIDRSTSFASNSS